MNDRTALAPRPRFSRLGCWLYALLAAIVVVAVAWLVWLWKGTRMEATVDSTIALTPAQVQSIQDIGQWEFLTITDEELVDTVRYGFFGDDELVRIYYGKLRLGIDLHKAAPQWLAVQGDTLVVATLPPVELLDRNFIDEARTQSFFEEGRWTDQDRQALYDRAYQKMLARCLTPANVKAAEKSAVEQMTHLLHTMGFERVSVQFEAATTTQDNSGQQHEK